MDSLCFVDDKPHLKWLRIMYRLSGHHKTKPIACMVCHCAQDE